MKNNKKVVREEQLKNQILELQRQSQEIKEYLLNLQTSVSTNFNICDENFDAIIHRLNYENR